MAVRPTGFAREISAEVGKVTWPDRRETIVTTGLVLTMSAIAAVFFFFVIDQIIGFGVHVLFSGGV
jgi:preprotein translocase subunit SecE